MMRAALQACSHSQRPTSGWLRASDSPNFEARAWALQFSQESLLIRANHVRGGVGPAETFEEPLADA